MKGIFILLAAVCFIAIVTCLELETEVTESSILCPTCVNFYCIGNYSEVGFNIPHPEFKCNKFCKCDFGGAVEFDCPDDLHFDQIKGICNWPVAANCNAILPYENCPTTNN